MSDAIEVSISDQILTIRIQRPEKLNAITHDMYTQMIGAFEQAESDAQVKAIFITGTEDTFTSGNDLGDFLNKPPAGQDSPVFNFLKALSGLKKPLIAAATGSAVGIGTTIFLHCDLVYLGESAKLKLPFVNLGLCPEAASSYLLPALVGHLRASQAILLGETITAQQALNWGLANECYPDETYQAMAYEKAKKLVKQPAASVRLSKQLLKQSQETIVSERMAEEGEHFVNRLVSPEAKEAFTAFMEKRIPDFSPFD